MPAPGMQVITAHTPPAQPVTTTKVLNFDTWPSYDAFFSVSGNSSVRNGSLATWDSSGNSIQGLTYSIEFSIPVGVTQPSISLMFQNSYTQALYLYQGTALVHTWSTPAAVINTVTLPLEAGKSYRLTSTATTTLNGNWLKVDDIQVSFIQ